MAAVFVVDQTERRRFVPLELRALIDAGYFRADECPSLADGRIVDAITGNVRRFTADEFEGMADLGFFDEEGGDRLELIDGEIYTMARVKSPHYAAIDRLSRVFWSSLADQVRVRIQAPVRLERENEPQPDIALVRPRDDDYEEAHPVPSEIFLVIEVMDTSHYRDRTQKLPRYAEAGIPEVWLVDLPNACIEVCREPVGALYTDRRTYVRGQMIAPAAFPDVTLAVEAILSRAQT